MSDAELNRRPVENGARDEASALERMNTADAVRWESHPELAPAADDEPAGESRWRRRSRTLKIIAVAALAGMLLPVLYSASGVLFRLFGIR